MICVRRSDSAPQLAGKRMICVAGAARSVPTLGEGGRGSPSRRERRFGAVRQTLLQRHCPLLHFVATGKSHGRGRGVLRGFRSGKGNGWITQPGQAPGLWPEGRRRRGPCAGAGGRLAASSMTVTIRHAESTRLWILVPTTAGYWSHVLLATVFASLTLFPASSAWEKAFRHRD